MLHVFLDLWLYLSIWMPQFNNLRKQTITRRDCNSTLRHFSNNLMSRFNHAIVVALLVTWFSFLLRCYHPMVLVGYPVWFSIKENAWTLLISRRRNRCLGVGFAQLWKSELAQDWLEWDSSVEELMVSPASWVEIASVSATLGFVFGSLVDEAGSMSVSVPWVVWSSGGGDLVVWSFGEICELEGGDWPFVDGSRSILSCYMMEVWELVESDVDGWKNTNRKLIGTVSPRYSAFIRKDPRVISLE